MSGFFNNNPSIVVNTEGSLSDLYTITNDTTLREFDATSLTLEELADVVATVIRDVQIGGGGATPGTNNVGYLNIPQNSQSADYTTVLTDSGKCIFHPASDTNDRNFIIAATGDVAYPVGTAMIFDNNSANDVLISSLDTITQDGTGDDGYFTLAQYGKATVMKDADGEWSIGGVGLTLVTPASFTKSSESLATLDTKLASGTGTITFSAPVLFVPTIGFFDVLDNSPAGGTITVTSGLGTATITVSWTAPDVDDVYIKGISVSNTGYALVNWVSNNYTLF